MEEDIEEDGESDAECKKAREALRMNFHEEPLSWNIGIIESIIHSDNDIYMSMMSIVIPDYLERIDITVILTYTENDKMIPERTPG